MKSFEEGQPPLVVEPSCLPRTRAEQAVDIPSRVGIPEVGTDSAAGIVVFALRELVAGRTSLRAVQLLVLVPAEEHHTQVAVVFCLLLLKKLVWWLSFGLRVERRAS
jgi:hypothetical protein